MELIESRSGQNIFGHSAIGGACPQCGLTSTANVPCGGCEKKPLPLPPEWCGTIHPKRKNTLFHVIIYFMLKVLARIKVSKFIYDFQGNKIPIRPTPTPTPTNGQWLYNKEGRPPPLPPSSSGGTHSYGTLTYGSNSTSFHDLIFFTFLLIISFIFGFITAYINF